MSSKKRNNLLNISKEELVDEILILREEIKESKKKHKETKEKNKEMKGKIDELNTTVKDLKGKLKMDSHNSSMPPSTDGFKKKNHTCNSRAKSNKPRGGQTGHKGRNLQRNNEVNETGMRVNAENYRIHTVCTELLSYYAHHKKRGSEAVDFIGILNKYLGKLVTDHWGGYKGEGFTRNFCNAHHLRELTGSIENENKLGAQKMKDLLLEIKARKDMLISEGKNEMEAEERLQYHLAIDKSLQIGNENMRR